MIIKCVEIIIPVQQNNNAICVTYNYIAHITSTAGINSAKTAKCLFDITHLLSGIIWREKIICGKYFAIMITEISKNILI